MFIVRPTALLRYLTVIISDEKEEFCFLESVLPRFSHKEDNHDAAVTFTRKRSQCSGIHTIRS